MDDNTAFWAHNEAIFRLTELCAGLQKDIHTLQCQVMELEQQVKDSDAHTALMQHGMEYLGSEVSSLAAMRDTLSAVFTIEAPAAAVCPECNGEGSDFCYICERCNGTGKWVDSFGPHRLHSDCEACQGTGKVQS